MDKNNHRDSFLFPSSFVLSIIVHFAVVVIVRYAMDLTFEKPLVNPDYIMVTTNFKEINNTENLLLEEKLKESTVEKITKSEGSKDSELPEAGNFFSFKDENVDTTLLEQLYSEQTLNVRVKYPAGWQFMDQNNKGKLDGVTFWATPGNYNPPPYIHLEVIEKYLFSESRYKYKRKMNDFTAFYNEPEELSGQVSQEVYCRTDSRKRF